MKTNRYRASCAECGGLVRRGRGVLSGSRRGGWRVVHFECEQRQGTPQEAPPAPRVATIPPAPLTAPQAPPAPSPADAHAQANAQLSALLAEPEKATS